MTPPSSSVTPLVCPQRCVGPIERMQDHAYGMLASRAYIHQYETYGMNVSDFQACFARIEDIAQRYSQL
jgi:tubulin delta